MRITDYGSLKAQIASYMHRDDIDDYMSGFVDLATARLGRDLRSRENEIVLDPFEVTQQMQALPDRFMQIKELSYPSGQGRGIVRSGSAVSLARFVQAGAGAQVYAIHGKVIEIVPFQAKDYRLIYWDRPSDLVEDGDTNDVLGAYPYLYLYAGLVEANFYTQDGGARDMALQTYTSEIDQVNVRSARSDMGSRRAIGG